MCLRMNCPFAARNTIARSLSNDYPGERSPLLFCVRPRILQHDYAYADHTNTPLSDGSMTLVILACVSPAPPKSKGSAVCADGWTPTPVGVAVVVWLDLRWVVCASVSKCAAPPRGHVTRRRDRSPRSPLAIKQVLQTGATGPCTPMHAGVNTEHTGRARVDNRSIRPSNCMRCLRAMIHEPFSTAHNNKTNECRRCKQMQVMFYIVRKQTDCFFFLSW